MKNILQNISLITLLNNALKILLNLSKNSKENFSPLKIFMKNSGQIMKKEMEKKSPAFLANSSELCHTHTLNKILLIEYLLPVKLKM